MQKQDVVRKIIILNEQLAQLFAEVLVKYNKATNNTEVDQAFQAILLDNANVLLLQLIDDPEEDSNLSEILSTNVLYISIILSVPGITNSWNLAESRKFLTQMNKLHSTIVQIGEALEVQQEEEE